MMYINGETVGQNVGKLIIYKQLNNISSSFSNANSDGHFSKMYKT